MKILFFVFFCALLGIIVLHKYTDNYSDTLLPEMTESGSHRMDSIEKLNLKIDSLEEENFILQNELFQAKNDLDKVLKHLDTTYKLTIN